MKFNTVELSKMDTSVRLNEFFVVNLWRWKCGLPEAASLDKLPPASIKNVFEDLTLFPEYREIVDLANNRFFQGQFRYGRHSLEIFLRYDTVKETYNRMRRYEKDGNLEHLVDALNMIRIEYYKGKKSGKKMFSIDDGKHAQPKGRRE